VILKREYLTHVGFVETVAAEVALARFAIR